MKKYLILITVLFVAIGLKGQEDTVWKNGVVYRTVTQYEKLLLVSDSTKLFKAKEVLRAPRIPIYDTVYKVDIPSFSRFFIEQRTGIITERGVSIETQGSQYYEKTSSFIEKQNFNFRLFLLVVLLIFSGKMVIVFANKKYVIFDKDSTWVHIFLFPILIGSLSLVLFIVSFVYFGERLPGYLLNKIAFMCFVCFYVFSVLKSYSIIYRHRRLIEQKDQ
jgi:hypothetical protein